VGASLTLVPPLAAPVDQPPWLADMVAVYGDPHLESGRYLDYEWRVWQFPATRRVRVDHDGYDHHKVTVEGPAGFATMSRISGDPFPDQQVRALLVMVGLLHDTAEAADLC
jgi:hypothetical protein